MAYIAQKWFLDLTRGRLVSGLNDPTPPNAPQFNLGDILPFSIYPLIENPSGGRSELYKSISLDDPQIKVSVGRGMEVLTQSTALGAGPNVSVKQPLPRVLTNQSSEWFGNWVEMDIDVDLDAAQGNYCLILETTIRQIRTAPITVGASTEVVLAAVNEAWGILPGAWYNSLSSTWLLTNEIHMVWAARETASGYRLTGKISPWANLGVLNQIVVANVAMDTVGLKVPVHYDGTLNLGTDELKELLGGDAAQAGSTIEAPFEIEFTWDGKRVTVHGECSVRKDIIGPDATVPAEQYLVYGPPGTSAFVYVAWAEDDQGSGFVLHRPDVSPLLVGKTHWAILSTDTPIETPTAADFEGLWAPLRAGPAGKASYVYTAYAKSDSGLDFTKDPVIGRSYPYIAFLVSEFDYDPPATDFVGKWLFKGPNGFDGWTPRPSVVARGDDLVLRIADWTGGSGFKPGVGAYVGAAGFVTSIDDAVNIRGSMGPRGWGPVYASHIGEDGGLYIKLTDYSGGEGDKPTANIGAYVGPTGLVADLEDATDFKGGTGERGWCPVLAVVDDTERSRRVHRIVGWIGGEGDTPTTYVGYYLTNTDTPTSDISEAATLSDYNVQADWNEADPESPSFIQNKPDLESVGAQADWNETDPESPAYIQNKPDLESVGAQADWDEEDTESPAYIQNKPEIAQADWEEDDTDAPGFIQNKPEIAQADWNEEDTESPAYIQNKPEIAQADWNEADTESPAFIQNKPTIAQADWDEEDEESPAFIQNKPTLPTAAGDVGAIPSAYLETALSPASDLKVPTSKAVADYINGLISGTFVPTDIASLGVWIKANAQVGTDGERLASLANSAPVRSGWATVFNHITQGAFLRSDGFYGAPGLDFNGDGGYSGAIPTDSFATGWWFAALVAERAATSGNRLFSAQLVGDTQNENDASGGYSAAVSGQVTGGGILSNGSTLAASGLYIITGLYTGAEMFCWQNGRLVTTFTNTTGSTAGAIPGALVPNSTPTVHDGTLHIGRRKRTASPLHLNGVVAEMMLGDGVPTFAQMRAIEAYLAKTYGFAGVLLA